MVRLERILLTMRPRRAILRLAKSVVIILKIEVEVEVEFKNF